MPQPSPFHERTSQHCVSLRWKDWAGFHAVCSYDSCHEPEYFAIRHAAGLIDVSPLFKYDVSGPDAASFLSRIFSRDATKLKIGQVSYGCWCDDQGKLMDDGTLTRWGENMFRLTAAEPTWHWLQLNARGFDVQIQDVSHSVAALAVQGPQARAIVSQLGGGEAESLKFFRAMECQVGQVPLKITRTGYTGDLGYELWCDSNHALDLYDQVMEAGEAHRLLPVGLDALDMTRVEAGFILNGVDYFSAHHCLVKSRQSTPYEMGLGWTLQLNREAFIGQAALQKEKEAGSAWALIGLEYDWDEFEALFNEFDLPPQTGAGAWRDGVPLYDFEGQQVGQATSGTWSPTLKKNLALASVYQPYAKPGQELKVEVTVEYQRRQITARVVPTPFFDPPRKRS